MLANPAMLYLFIIANLAITAGYLFLATAVVPKVAVELLRTKIGGVGFFLLCGLTHLDMARMAIFGHTHGTYAELATQWHMLAIHIPQAICVWLFVTGTYIEMGDYGLLRTRHAKLLQDAVERQAREGAVPAPLVIWPDDEPEETPDGEDPKPPTSEPGT